jgi:GNAT superfamily N-acetyltransferase
MENSCWNFVPLEKKHNRKDFDCGNRELNIYLKQYARQNDKSGINKTFVATKTDTPLIINGYYTISSSTIDFQSLPEQKKRKLPAYPIPAVLIGKLAVDVSSQGKGLGTELLVNALIRIVKASNEVGIYAVRVDALDDKAKRFYLKHEFIPFEDNSLSLFLPLKTIAISF